jgi:hypothetical protein
LPSLRVVEARLLRDLAAGFDHLDLALDFVFQRLRMKRNELTFLTSALVPNSFWPRGRTLTLASQRSEPSSMLQSLTPV